MLVAEAPVWHFWIAPILVASTIGLILAMVAGYLYFVTSKQYPSRKQRKQMKQ